MGKSLRQRRREYDPQVIGFNLRRLREEKGYTVEEIRDYLYLGSVQAVYKYEEGRSLPKSDTLLALMELYGVGIEELLKPDRERSEKALCFEAGSDRIYNYYRYWLWKKNAS